MASSQAQVVTQQIVALRIDTDSEFDGQPGKHAGVKNVTDQAVSLDEGVVLEVGSQQTPNSLVANTEAFLEDAGAVDEKHDELDNFVTAWWTTAHTIQPGLIDTVDDNIRALLPPGTEIISISPSGTSNFSRTAEIQTELDGEDVSYFLKASDYPSAPQFFASEFESLRVMHRAVPGHCVDPVGWGQYASRPDVYFLLMPFVEMFHDSPDPQMLPKTMSQLHWNATAPDGLFGFPIGGGGGILPMKLSQTASWEDYLGRHLRFLVRAEELSQGDRPSEMTALLTPLFERIIPRLIRPLETGERTIVPRLVHTDLWTGNRAYNEKGEDIIFDPCGIYAHNEFELGVWHLAREPYGQEYLDSYHSHFERSSPEEDYEGRTKLYALAFEMRVSATLVGHNQMFRKECIRYMRELNESYPETYEEWALSRNEPVCPPKVVYRSGWP